MQALQLRCVAAVPAAAAATRPRRAPVARCSPRPFQSTVSDGRAAPPATPSAPSDAAHTAPRALPQPGCPVHAMHKAPAAGGAAAGAAPPPPPLSGPGGCWRVLPHGNIDQLPGVPCKPGVEVTAENPLGEFGELEAAGAGPFLLQRFRAHGPVFSWAMGPQVMTTIVDATTIRSLLKEDNKCIVGWNPESLYAMLGEAARQSMEQPSVRVFNRRLMAPGFTKEALSGYMSKLVAICSSQLEAWSAAGRPIDLASEGKELSFQFSTQLLVDFDIPPEQQPEMRARFDALFKGLFSPVGSPAFTKGVEARSQLLAELEAIIRTREAGGRQAGGGGGGGSGVAERVHKNVFDYVVDSQAEEFGGIDFAAAASSGIGLIIAGNDTSGLGVSALMAILPLFPNVVESLRHEQQQVIERFGADLTPASLDGTPFADAVVREVLRVAPPSAAIFRRTTADMEICGKFVPAGSPLMLSSWMGQVLTDPQLQSGLDALSPDAWAALEASWGAIRTDTLRSEFKPERWLGQGAAAKPSGLLTFSAGPHVCLGMSLFMTEAKVLLALLARGYDLELGEAAAGAAATGAASDREAGPEFAVALGNVLLHHAAVRVHKREAQPAASV